MATRTNNNRRSSFSSSTSSSLAKHNAAQNNNVGNNVNSNPKPNAKDVKVMRNRQPLRNLTNINSNSTTSSSSSFNLLKVRCSTKPVKQVSLPGNANNRIGNNGLVSSSSSASSSCAATAIGLLPVASATSIRVKATSSTPPSDGSVISMDGSSTFSHSFTSPELHYMDSDVDDEFLDVDLDSLDPQLCATNASDIYNHLRASETKKRPSTNYMEQIQKDVNASMRSILVDWLVEVSEEYRLVPDTLYLTVNYIDRYLSGNAMDRQRLQLLGVACMMIASKYEEICAPQVEEFCYITDNTYFKEEVLQMESAVLNYMKFEMTATTTKCFLRRFVRIAQTTSEIPAMQLECMANYIAELSLLEYSMLPYNPSLIAASSTFLAKYILMPAAQPWNSTLSRYTLYQPSELHDCVQALHQLCRNSKDSCLPAVRDKYSQHKYKCVAKKQCPCSIPVLFFKNTSR